MIDMDRLLVMAAEDPTAAAEIFRYYRRTGDIELTQSFVYELNRSQKYEMHQIARLLINAGEPTRWAVDDPQNPSILPLRDLYQQDHLKISPNIDRALIIAGLKIPLRWNEYLAHRFNDDCIQTAIRLLEQTFERSLGNDSGIRLINRLQENQWCNQHRPYLANPDPVRDAHSILLDLSEDAAILIREVIQCDEINEEQYQIINQLNDALHISNCDAQTSILISYYLGERG